jgi:hypothetical protein
MCGVSGVEGCAGVRRCMARRCWGFAAQCSLSAPPTPLLPPACSCVPLQVIKPRPPWLFWMCRVGNWFYTFVMSIFGVVTCTLHFVTWIVSGIFWHIGSCFGICKCHEMEVR